MQVKGFAKPIRYYNLLGLYDDLVSEGSVIREEDDGLRILLDLQRQDKARAIRKMENVLSRLRALPDGDLQRAK